MPCKHNRLTRIISPGEPDAWKCTECKEDFEITPRKITVVQPHIGPDDGPPGQQAGSRPAHPHIGPEDGPPGQNEN